MILNDENVFNELIVPCKKGEFIFVICKNKKSIKELKLIMKGYKLPYKRGVFTWKGIIVIGLESMSEWKQYFDKIIEVE